MDTRRTNMRIKVIEEQHRRDITGILECEHCGAEEMFRGYDDDHYHRNVIPSFRCRNCNKTASLTYQPLTPKYGPNEVI